jgi:predicted Zn finger-like uncharacterized protein
MDREEESAPARAQGPSAIRMIIVCPQCESRYDVGEDRLPEAGRPVRCTRCRAEWVAYPGMDEVLADQSWILAERAGSTALDAPRAARPTSEAPELVESAVPSPPPPEGEGEPQRSRTPSARPPRRRPSAAKGPGRRLSRVIVLAAVAACAWFAVTRREAVVRAWPEVAGLYARLGLAVNLRGIVFENVTTAATTEAGLPVLVVEGSMRNIARDPVSVPRLRFAIRDDKQVELYSWTAVASRNELASDAVLAFKTRLASPPNGGQTVAVRFVRRDDLVAAQ